MARVDVYSKLFANQIKGKLVEQAATDLGRITVYALLPSVGITETHNHTINHN